MGNRPGERIGIIYGEVESTEFRFACSDPDAKRLDYVMAAHPGGLALGQISDIQRHSQLSFDEAMSLGRSGPAVSGDQVSCTVRVIGYRDERGLLQLPRTPFKAGTEVRRATSEIVQKVLGLTASPDEGAYLGFLKGTDFPVVLDVDTLVQKHASILAKTGAGKSYTVGVLIEELLKKRVPLLIIDPHGEYGTLVSPNIEPKEIDNLIRFGLKPKSFQKEVTEYALDARLALGAQKLHLDSSNLDAQEILQLLHGKVSQAQQGLLYQAVNAVKKAKPALYKFQDIIDELQKSPSNAKWPLVAALENLQSTGVFGGQGTPIAELVRPGHATLLNLKGAAPEIQEIVVARLARALFDARKRNTVPAFLFVVEEAHNFCPERGIGAALSGPELRTIASEGRKFGMGLLIVSQRPAKVDKNVLSQCNTQIIMKVTNPNDLKAITGSVEGITSDSADEIQRLGTGVSLVAGGRLAAPVLVEVRARQTRHGGKSVSVMVDEEDVPPPAAEPAPASDAGEAIEPHEAPPPEAEPLPAVAAPVEPETVAQDLPPPRRLLREPAPEAATKAPWGPQVELPTPPPPAPPPPAPAPSARKARLVPVPRAPAEPEVLLPEPPAELRSDFEPEEAVVQRVLARVGYPTRSGREAIVKVKELARTVPMLSGDDYVRAYGRVGRTFCYPSHPECGPCPLLPTCRLGSQRLNRGEIKAGKWGQRS